MNVRRWTVALSLIALLLCAAGDPPEQELEPRVWLPLVHGGYECMGACDFAELDIQTRERQTDGTMKLVSVSLLSPASGFCVSAWNPATAQPKGGGVWRDSGLAHGRRLAMRKRQNIRDVLTVEVRAFNPDALVKDTRDLRAMLEKAASYTTVR